MPTASEMIAPAMMVFVRLIFKPSMNVATSPFSPLIHLNAKNIIPTVNGPYAIKPPITVPLRALIATPAIIAAIIASFKCGVNCCFAFSFNAVLSITMCLIYS